MINKIALMAVLILFSMTSASAELYLWSSTSASNVTSTVTHNAFYRLEDTSNDFISIARPVLVAFNYETETLPYNISAVYPQYENALVDWCNFTVRHDANEFGTDYQIVNSTATYQNVFISGTAGSGTLTFFLKNKDTINAVMQCHYTNNQTLFIDSVLIGRFSTNFPAFEYAQCKDHNYEEITEANDNLQTRTNEELNIWATTQLLIEKNAQLWFIGFWVIKIMLLIVSIEMVFIGFYFIYMYIKKLSGRVR